MKVLWNEFLSYQSVNKIENCIWRVCYLQFWIHFHWWDNTVPNDQNTLTYLQGNWSINMAHTTNFRFLHDLRQLLCLIKYYCQTSNVSHILVGNEIIRYSDVSPISVAPTTSSFQLNTWQWNGQRQLPDVMKNILVLGFGAPYIRGMTRGKYEAVGTRMIGLISFTDYHHLGKSSWYMTGGQVNSGH